MDGLAVVLSLVENISRSAPVVKLKGRDSIPNGKKMGRPIKADEPKTVSLHLRITKSEADRIQKCSDLLDKPRTDTILAGVELLEKKLKLS